MRSKDMSICELCDNLKPHVLGPYGYAFLDLHRAWHHLGRIITDPLERLLGRMSR